MQITLDIRNMNTTEREHLAGFIMTYPTAKKVTPLGANVQIQPTISDADLDKALKVLDTPTAPYGGPDNEMQLLDHEHQSTLPELAFGTGGELVKMGDTPEQVFGNVTPLVQPVTHAPAGVGAGQSTTAPVVAPPAPVTTPSAPTADLVVTAPTVAAPATLASTVELDKHQLPWDHRIHSESKAKIADGSWRKKRGVDAAIVTQVEAELRAVLGAGAPLAQPLMEVLHPTPPVPVVEHAIPFETPATAIPPPPPQAANTDAAKQQYVALIGRVSAAISSKRVTLEAVTAVCAEFGIPALPLLNLRLDLVPTVAERIDAIILPELQT